MSLRLRPVTTQEHLAFIQSRSAASFLQCPSWGHVKSGWRSESLGWVDAQNRVKGAALVLYRKVPRFNRYFAYVPEGPVIDWSTGELDQWLNPLVEHVRRRRAFGIKIGPPVTDRRWAAPTVKAAIASRSTKRLPDLPSDASNPVAPEIRSALAALGWRPPSENGDGFTAGQPRYVFQVPLADRTLDEVFAGFNQLWRRNIRRAGRGKVEVVKASAGDLSAFHELYMLTAERDHFTGRPLSYFQRMQAALAAEAPDRFSLYLARHEGESLAATISVRVGDHFWYSYGASASHKRDLRPSNAIQWQMLQDAYAAGANVYDMRGISDTLDETDHLFGLIQFKLGTGGEAVEYLGEWDLPLNKLLYRAFETYLAVR